MAEIARTLRKELLTRAGAAASAGNAAETERWLANADGAGAARADIAAIRRSLQDTLIGARTDKVATLTQSFNAALAANKLLQPADGSAKYLPARAHRDRRRAIRRSPRRARASARLTCASCAAR